MLTSCTTYYARTFKTKLRNRYIHEKTISDGSMYCIETSSITRIQRVNNICLNVNAFVILLLVMIPLHMLTFRLMITVVAEFCSLVIHS